MYLIQIGYPTEEHRTPLAVFQQWTDAEAAVFHKWPDAKVIPGDSYGNQVYLIRDAEENEQYVEVRRVKLQTLE